MTTAVLIAQNLFAYRVANGKTQTYVGKKIGVTFQQIQKYENSVNTISVLNLLRFCDLFKINIGIFLYSNPDEVIDRSTKIDDFSKSKYKHKLKEIEMIYQNNLERKSNDKGRSYKDMVGQSLDPRTYL